MVIVLYSFSLEFRTRFAMKSVCTANKGSRWQCGVACLTVIRLCLLAGIYIAIIFR